jgi:hypothetical protein
MANYFNNFPLTLYSLSANNNINLDTVTNITARFAFEETLKENSSAFYPYEIKDTDTPEIIAAKYYNNPERHWIVLMFNDIIDPQYDWPLSYPNFIKYVSEKYAANGAANATVQTGLTWAQSVNNIHSYYQVNTRTMVITTSDNKTITEKIRITSNAYANLAETTTTYTLSNNKQIKETVTKQKLTYYDYEMEQNEAKRKIKLIKPIFVNQIVEEFKQIINP